MDLVHDRGSMDPVHESGPWSRSKVRVHGPLVHVLSSPDDKGAHEEGAGKSFSFYCHCHAIENKNANHSIQEVQNLGNERR